MSRGSISTGLATFFVLCSGLRCVGCDHMVAADLMKHSRQCSTLYGLPTCHLPSLLCKGPSTYSASLVQLCRTSYRIDMGLQDMHAPITVQALNDAAACCRHCRGLAHASRRQAGTGCDVLHAHARSTWVLDVVVHTAHVALVCRTVHGSCVLGGPGVWGVLLLVWLCSEALVLCVMCSRLRVQVPFYCISTSPTRGLAAMHETSVWMLRGCAQVGCVSGDVVSTHGLCCTLVCLMDVL